MFEEIETGTYTMSINEDSPRDSSNSDDSKLISRSISLRSYNKWSPVEHGVTMAWRDVNVYATKGPKKIKRLLNNCSGAITSGSLVAIIGASGSGKSTLMSALAYRNPRNTVVHGDILINGCQIGSFMRRLSGFVHQDDLFFGSLTVLEHLTCMAHLKLDRRVSPIERKCLIQDILERTGLVHCMNTRIGEEGEKKVLSGGEKKRLAFATELLTQPAILFCDEPTSGLDSFNAQKLVETLQQLAEKRNTAIFCTIHQPSSELFAMFDQVLLLSEGRVAFFGDPDDSLEFFAENGYRCPENYNPADYLINVVSIEHGVGENAAQRTSKRICDMFAVSDAAQQRDLLVNLEMHMWESGSYHVEEDLINFRPPSSFSTLYWLIWRFFMCAIRDPKVQYLRVLQKVAIAVMAGLIYAGSITITQTGVQAIQGIIFLFVSENTFTPMYSTLSIFPQTIPIFLREFKSGLYTPDRYYLANAIALLPGLILEPMIFIIIAYWLAALRPTLFAFLITVIASTLVMNVSCACGCFFSATFNSLPMAMAYLVPFDYILMITSGVFIKINTLPTYLAFLPYFSWLLYGNEVMSIAQWDGIQDIPCSNSTGGPCFISGEDVLNYYDFKVNHLYLNLFIMMLLYLLFHTLGYVSLYRRAKNS